MMIIPLWTAVGGGLDSSTHPLAHFESSRDCYKLYSHMDIFPGGLKEKFQKMEVEGLSV